MKYRYTGRSRAREKVSGIIEADDELEARIRLRAMQIRPLEVRKEEKSLFGGQSINFNYGRAIKLKHLIVFTRQLSSLVDSGVSVVRAIELLENQESDKSFKKTLQTIRLAVESGGTLASAMEKFPAVFNEFFVRIVEAGEVSGTLDKSLRSVGVQLEKLAKTKSKVIKALSYPAFTLVASIVAVIFLLLKVIPEISKLYGTNKLPDITVFVLGLANWVQNNVTLIFLTAVGIPVGIAFLYKMQAFRVVWDPIVLRLPIFGQLVVRASVARFARTLSTLVASGVPLLTAFDICTKVITNIALKNSIKQASVGVSEGKSIVEGLSRLGHFPPMVLHMISIGEMTGRLDELLEKVADIYDDEVDNAVDTVTGLLQPLLIMAVGGMILFLMLAMYSPIMNLGEKMSLGG